MTAGFILGLLISLFLAFYYTIALSPAARVWRYRQRLGERGVLWTWRRMVERSRVMWQRRK